MIRLMDVTKVDPRDQTWELDAPRYRVYFHDEAGTSYEHEISGADVDEVIAYAEQKRGSRSYVLYACVPQDGIGLIRLAGSDPNSGSSVPAERGRRR